MANPQLHNGHTRIANEILNEIMKTNLNGTQFRLVLAIWRFTYGFQRKSHDMSVTYLAELLNTSRSAVDRELTALIDRNIITVIEIGNKGARVLSFNKNYKEWGDKDPAKEPVPEIPKPKKKAETKKKYDEDNTYYKMALYFYERVGKVANEAGIAHLIKKSNMQTWADDMRKLIEIDEVDKRLAKEVMDWVGTDNFWKANILSAKKLREKFMELAIKMKAQKEPVKPKQQQKPDSRDKEIALQKWIAEGKDPDEFSWD